jgi:glycerol-3-phosphate dehydrogenase subunit B
MPPKDNTHSCDLMVIGAGMAGMAAALFAVRRGLTVVQAGLSGETLYASGLFDLYGVTHGGKRQLIDNPWQGIKRLKTTHNNHPYCRVSAHQIRSGMDQLTAFLGKAGLPYKGRPDTNVRLVTPVGTIKRTFRVPATMWNGAKALEEKAPTLFVDINGLRGFSARQIVETLKPSWPGLKAASIDLPWENRLGPKYAEHIARGLDVEAPRRNLATAIRSHLGRVKYVGLPAILGIHATEGAHGDLEKILGRAVFEIPTMPPAVAGVRLKETFDRHLPQMGVKTFYHHRVFSAQRRNDGRFILALGKNDPEHTVWADHVLLATGRFLGKGLAAERQGIRETLFNLPVSQPENRSCWHREGFLDPRGHAINLAGIEVDDHFRPLNPGGRVIHQNLYAAGSILAHQDWIRTKSGTGLAVATAYGAIEALVGNRQKNRQ